MDWFLALVLLVLTSPIFLILSIWIKLDSKGPVIY
ncbi:sugar transferase, partial [Burkholderia contaminans]|nr:sugar transferase [Burkholderia contaminans]